MESICFDDRSFIEKNVTSSKINCFKVFVSHMKAFQPKMMVLENDNVPMPVFKELIIKRLFNAAAVPSSTLHDSVSRSTPNTPDHTAD